MKFFAVCSLGIATFVSYCEVQVGDIYQNLLTDERIEIISVGPCQELYDAKLKAWEAFSDLIEDEDETTKRALFASLPFPVPSYFDEETEGEQPCHSYTTPTYMEAFELTIQMEIIQVNEKLCSRRWKKLN